MKSFKPLISFIWYCLIHREQRFWQALRNWKNVCRVYIEVENKNVDDAELLDTYYLLGK